MKEQDRAIDKKYPTWDGELEKWPEYVKQVRFTWGETRTKDRPHLASGLARNLRGEAWKAVVRGRLNHAALETETGVEYLLDFLEDAVCKRPLPDIGVRLEEFFFRMKRQRMESMSAWCLRHRNAYHRLYRALRRFKTKGRSESPETPAPSSHQGGTPERSPPRPTPTMTETLLTTPPPGGYERVAREGEEDETASRSDGHPATGPRIREDEDIDDILPDPVVGWFLLRRAMLPPLAKAAVLASTKNSTETRLIEDALRDHFTDDEVPALDGHRRQGHGRRIYSAEEDGWWSQMNLKEDEMDDSFVTFGEWTMDHNESDEAHSWWNDWGHRAHPSTPEPDDKLAELEAAALHAEQEHAEIYAAHQAMQRNLTQARQAVGEHRQQRGYWPPGMKGGNSFKGKSPGKSKGGKKGKGKAYWTDDYSWYQEPWTGGDIWINYQPKSTKGKGAFSGCFRCGSLGHKAAECPQSSGTPATNSASFVLMISEDVDRSTSYEDPESQGLTTLLATRNEELPTFTSTPLDNARHTSLTTLGTMTCEADHQDINPCSGKIREEDLAVLATLAEETKGLGIIDCGATETIGSLDNIENLYRLRVEKYGPESIEIDSSQNRRFRFGNGKGQNAENLTKIQQTIGGKEGSLAIHGLGAQNVSILISIKTLRILGAVIDFRRNVAIFENYSSRPVRLQQASSGHLMVDLTSDWLKQAGNSPSSQECSGLRRLAQAIHKTAGTAPKTDS